jgi:hypothetical protein
MRRLVAVAVVVAALGGAGVAGAIVDGIVTSIGQGQWARLGTTSIYCHAFTENQANNNIPGFDCGDWASNAHVARSYSAIIDATGAEVDRWDLTGRHVHRVVTYLNP